MLLILLLKLALVELVVFFHQALLKPNQIWELALCDLNTIYSCMQLGLIRFWLQSFCQFYLLKYPKRIKRNPFAGLIAHFYRPGARGRTAYPSPLVILSAEQ